MARPNPNIPLQVQGRDFSTPLLKLREAERQSAIDESNLRTAGLQQEGLEMQNEASRQQLNAGRMREIGLNTLAIPKLIDLGQTKDVGRLIMRNINLMTEIDPNMDTSQAERLAQLNLMDPQAAKEFLEKEAIPRLKAIMPELFQSEVLSDAQVSDTGQTFTRGPDGTVTATDVQGFKGNQSLSLIQRFPADGGEPQTIQSDGRGGFVDLSGKPIQINPKDRLIEGSSLTGGAEELGVSNSVLEDLMTSEVNVRNYIATAGEVIDTLNKSPDSNTWIAGVASAVNSLQANINAISRQAGVEIDETLFDPSGYEASFDDLGIKDAQMKSLITTLAYQRARVNDPGGRLSDRDVNAAIQEIGAASGDPRAFAQVILDTARRADRNFRTKYQVSTKSPFDGDLGLANLPGFSQPTDGPLTLEQVNALSPEDRADYEEFLQLRRSLAP